MSGRILHVDFESFCFEKDLRKCGLYVYTDYADLWCMAWAFDDEKVNLWTPGQILPERIRYHLAMNGEFWAHNAAFECEMWNKVGVQKYDFPVVGAKNWVCTAAMSYAMSIPGNLEGAAAAMGISQQKDMEGAKVMMKLSRLERREDASREDLEKLYAYCKQDVEVERELGKRLLRLSKSEEKIWRLDQTINSRGIMVDIPSIRLAIDVVDREKHRLDGEMASVTKSAVTACTQISRLKDWVERETGRQLDSIGKSTVVELISDHTVPAHVRSTLLLRQEAGKSSVSKLSAMLDSVGRDSRIRGALQFHGSHTGRWSGRLFQPQNLPRMKYEEWEVASIFELLRRDDAVDAISLFHGPPMQVISSVLRAFIIAGEGKRLFYGDYNAIEARVLAWLAGENHVLETFRQGRDIYVETYARSFNVHRDHVTKEQRNSIGKVQVLACGYQGGVGAYQTMATNAGIKVPDEEASRLVEAWRRAHPNIVRYWYALDEAFLNAIRYPGDEFFVGPHDSFRRICVKTKGSFLLCKLPSGRLLVYPYPRIVPKTFTSKKTGLQITKDAIVYKGVASTTRKFGDLTIYGGLIAENITQAVSRDIMANAMLNLEEERYPVILTVHDEIVSERSGGSCEEMQSIMEVLPEWAKEIPIKASVSSGKRYLK